MDEKDNLVPIPIRHFQDALFQFWHDHSLPLWMVDHDILPSDKSQRVHEY